MGRVDVVKTPANLYTAGLAVGVLGLAVFAFWVARRGVAGVAADAGGAVVDAAGGVVTGVVGGVSGAVGLPTPADTTTDPAVARWLIDNAGWFTASKWSGAPALFKAMTMAEGSGTPPPSGSPLWTFEMKTDPGAADETERLLRRYPMPVGEVQHIGTEPVGYAWGA